MSADDYDYVDPLDVPLDTGCTCRFAMVHSRRSGPQWVLRRDRACPVHSRPAVNATEL